ncbi:MAG: hypothetical protein R3Y63_04140 [Eubacteriales bacterium]
MGDLSVILEGAVEERLALIEAEVGRRAVLASRSLRDSAHRVLEGERSGRIYAYGGSRYRASAAGEAPARRSGKFRQSWGTYVQTGKSSGGYVARAGVESGLTVGGHLLGDLLEEGTERMAPRPYKEAVIKGAQGEISALFGKVIYD